MLYPIKEGKFVSEIVKVTDVTGLRDHKTLKGQTLHIQKQVHKSLMFIFTNHKLSNNKLIYYYFFFICLNVLYKKIL